MNIESSSTTESQINWEETTKIQTGILKPNPTQINQLKDQLKNEILMFLFYFKNDARFTFAHGRRCLVR